MYRGLVSLGGVLTIYLTTRSGNTPLNAASLPTWRAYDLSGFMPGQSGSVSFGNSGSVTGATNASPIVITSTAHGLTTGTRVTITGVEGNTAANGTFVVTRINDNTYSLDGSTGNGAYTSGGTAVVTGLYKLSITASTGNGYAVNKSYTIRFDAEVNSAAWAELAVFGVC